MRSIFGAALMSLIAGVTVSACAAVSGLDGYQAGVGDGSTSTLFEAGPQEAPPTGDDALQADDPAPPDDAPGGSSSGSSSGGPPADAASDGPPPCGPTSCNGCCTLSGCHGGASVTTCGKGGVTCSDCTSVGGCNSGRCGTPPKDAGTQGCTASSCPVCAVALYTSCCKGDHTCGCQWTAFAPCQ